LRDTVVGSAENGVNSCKTHLLCCLHYFSMFECPKQLRDIFHDKNAGSTSVHYIHEWTPQLLPWITVTFLVK